MSRLWCWLTTGHRMYRLPVQRWGSTGRSATFVTCRCQAREGWVEDAP